MQLKTKPTINRSNMMDKTKVYMQKKLIVLYVSA